MITVRGTQWTSIFRLRSVVGKNRKCTVLLLFIENDCEHQLYSVSKRFGSRICHASYIQEKQMINIFYKKIHCPKETTEKIQYTVTGNVLLANMERLSLHTLCLLFTYRLWNLLFLKNTIHFTHHKLMSHLITLNNKHDWWEPSYINPRLEIYSLLNLWNIMSGKCSHSSFELEG